MMCVIIAANYLDTGWAAGMGLVMPQDFGAVLHIGGAKGTAHNYCYLPLVSQA